MASAMLNCLLFIRFVEVPAELLVKRFSGLQSKFAFAAVIECSKYHIILFYVYLCRSLLKGTIWWLMDYRMVPNRLSMDVNRPIANRPTLFPELKDADKLNEIEIRMMALDQCCQGKTIEERTRNFIRENAPRPPANLHFSPQKEPLQMARELAHICRPAVYSIFMLMSVYDDDKSMQLAGWLLSLSMDYFSCWPELYTVLSGSKRPPSESVEEVEEKEFRLLRMGMYLFRQPFFSDHTKPFLDGFVDKLDQWRILSPIATTAKAYLSLCEESLLYTSSS